MVLILVLSDFSHPLKLYTDASKVGIGAIFSQHIKLVAFFNEMLSRVKHSYNTYDVEFYVIEQIMRY